MMRVRVLMFAFAAFVLSVSIAQASDPIGIYAIVDKVVLEPNENSPQRIQIWGAFALTDGKSGDGYLAAQKGVLYYTLAPGKEAISSREWADLKSIAGTGQGIGFGMRYAPTGRIRKTVEKTDSPDTYPTGVGLIKMSSVHNQASIIVQLKDLTRKP